MNKEKRHKNMKESPPFQFTENMEIVGVVDSRVAGGLVSIDGDRALSFRGGKWRKEQGDPVVREADVVPIKEISISPNYKDRAVGGEIELFGWDPETGDIFPIYAEDSQILVDLINHNNGVHFEELDDYTSEHPGKLNFSAEFLDKQIEINFPHSADPVERSINQVRALRALAAITERNGKRILPIGALPNRQVEPGDVNPDPYVQRIVFQHMTWDNAQHFIGTSFQTHVEMFDSETALRSINYLQQTAPLLLALSSSSPFVKGKTRIGNEEVPGTGEIRAEWQSVRFLGRKHGSPSGGAIKEPAPEILDKYYNRAQPLLEENEIPSTARTLGHHTSYRFRDDLNTLEHADPDNFAANVEKLAAFAEFSKALTMKVQVFIFEGREDELPENLFGALDQEKLAVVEQDFVSVSRYGMQAAVHRPDGTEVSAQEQFQELLEWVTEPDDSFNFDGLTEGVKGEMIKSSMILHDEDFDEYDPSSADFISNYYKTGLGTASQWLHRRARHLVENEGSSEEEAVVTCMNELSEAFHGYMKDPELDERVVNLFV